jgi:hypothetical protein
VGRRLPDEDVEALDAVESDVSLSRSADDVQPTLHPCRGRHADRPVSDIRVDIRPAFAAAGLVVGITTLLLRTSPSLECRGLDLALAVCGLATYRTEGSVPAWRGGIS